MRTRFLLVGGVLAGVMPAIAATAQQPAPMLTSRTHRLLAAPPSLVADLDSLVARAVSASPSLRAATARVEAARARVSPASALPDPTLMAGIVNQPLGRMTSTSSPQGTSAGASGPDPMTMRMIGVGQTLPYPGKLTLRRRAAEREVEVNQASLDATRRQIVRDVKSSYYELAFIDEALGIVTRHRDVLASLITVTEARYGVGMAGQQDVLKARVDATRLAETASVLNEQRRAAVAQLDALLDQPSETEMPAASIPEPISRAAVASSPEEIRFTSAVLGSRAAGSPLRPLAELQDAATRQSPDIREHEAMIAAQAARVELARKGYLPDIDLSLQYGQRGGGLPDMVSATVSVPIPIFKGRKQDQGVAEATAELAALEAEHHAKTTAVRAEVARLVSDVERERTHLALAVKAILPQSRAALASASASYPVGKVEFLSVLENQATVFNYETDYYRALSDFAKNVAELERIVGEEVLR
jgi:outer membrane protein TolC